MLTPLITPTSAYGAHAAGDPLQFLEIKRRQPGLQDVSIEILYCGVCHSDLHQVRNEWGVATYPLVPGHEIVGRITEVGAEVSNHKVGDIVGVGCMVDSCRSCEACQDGLEQYCEHEEGMTQTYNTPDKISGGVTYGGYSTHIVVDQDFVLRIPPHLDLAASAPLLCAGITTYSPLKHWKVGAGDKVGIIGLGGLGHMGVKFAHAMGARVVVITRSADKEAVAKKLGADEVLLIQDEKARQQHQNSFDFILNTIPVGHDLDPYVPLLKRDKTMVIVGAVEPIKGLNGLGLIFRRRRIAGSLIGGIKETQEMLDFCGKHNIICEIEMINMQDINSAYERMLKSDVKYRFVIDMKSLKKNSAQ
jgi:uncharacterized zinc-type alcohol dehydrogenase-like protein